MGQIVCVRFDKGLLGYFESIRGSAVVGFHDPPCMAYETGFYYFSRESAFFVAATHFFHYRNTKPYVALQNIYSRYKF
jgi:hypothetical protein